jgi:hypothetical protein
MSDIGQVVENSDKAREKEIFNKGGEVLRYFGTYDYPFSSISVYSKFGLFLEARKLRKSGRVYVSIKDHGSTVFQGTGIRSRDGLSFLSSDAYISGPWETNLETFYSLAKLRESIEQRKFQKVS